LSELANFHVHVSLLLFFTYSVCAYQVAQNVHGMHKDIRKLLIIISNAKTCLIGLNRCI